MSQNRNKLIDLFIGNISNAILHRILEKAIKQEEISKHYQKEMRTSWDIAVKYREKINPPANFPLKDASEIRERLVRKVKTELVSRIAKGYKNLNLSSVEPEVEEALKEMNIT